MDLTFSEPELAFRDELRAWFADHEPGRGARRATRTPTTPGGAISSASWPSDGWAAVHWPPEYGGRGATLTQSAIFFEELGRSGAPLPANVLGLLLAGPDDHDLGDARSRRSAISPRSSPPRRSGARGSPSRTPAPTWPA